MDLRTPTPQVSSASIDPTARIYTEALCQGCMRQIGSCHPSNVIILSCGECFVHAGCSGGTCNCGVTPQKMDVRCTLCFGEGCTGSADGYGMCSQCMDKAVNRTVEKIKCVQRCTVLEARRIVKSELRIGVVSGAPKQLVANSVYSRLEREKMIVFNRETVQYFTDWIASKLTRRLEKMHDVWKRLNMQLSESRFSEFVNYARTSPKEMQFCPPDLVRKCTPLSMYDIHSMQRRIELAGPSCTDAIRVCKEYDMASKHLSELIETGKVAFATPILVVAKSPYMHRRGFKKKWRCYKRHRVQQHGNERNQRKGIC